MIAQSIPISIKPSSRSHTVCRVCKTPLGKPYLDLGEQPLANALRAPGDTSEEARFPLAVALCENCGLSQLTVVVDPEILYKGYRFRSGTSEAWRKHCAELAEQCGEPGQVLDIAANDGTLLDTFHARGWRCVGIDPAPVNPRASSDYIVLAGYWPQDSIEIALFCNARFDLVIAQNVLGHVDDPIDFLKGIKAVLAEDGQAVIEVPNVGNLIDDCAFDTIYHEHLSYWNGTAMYEAANKAGLDVARYEQFLDIHGGSVRYWLEHRTATTTVSFADVRLSNPYALFGQRVSQRINQLAGLLVNSRKKKLVAWGASAKGAVMLNAVANRWVSRWLPQYVIDETPEKQGLLMPGVHLVPIVAPPADLSGVDMIWILSWNWAEQIKEKARARGFTGKFLVTSPRVGLVD